MKHLQYRLLSGIVYPVEPDTRPFPHHLVRQIQQLRKEADLAISDRIVTYVQDSHLLHEVLDHFGDYVREETLTVDLVQIHPGQENALPAHLPKTTFELGTAEVTVAVAKKG